MLSDTQIKARLNDTILIEPYKAKNLGPNSYDLTLSKFAKIPKIHYNINLIKDVPEYYDTTFPLFIQPGEMVIGLTEEIVGVTGDIVGFLMKRSNLTRLGLDVVIAPFIDTGFKGHLSIVMHNISPYQIEIHPGIRICQVGFMKTGEVGISYDKRELSKNIDQIEFKVPGYRIDKEYR